MPSFDIVSEVNQVEVAMPSRRRTRRCRRASTSRARTRASNTRQGAHVYADDDFKLSQVTDILTGKFTKRGVDIRALDFGEVQKVGGNKVKQPVTCAPESTPSGRKRSSSWSRTASSRCRRASRATRSAFPGRSATTLQEAIALVRKSVTDFPMQFNNFRD
jgi:uncharacterized protein YajQ (UPF0234 family)